MLNTPPSLPVDQSIAGPRQHVKVDVDEDSILDLESCSSTSATHRSSCTATGFSAPPAKSGVRIARIDGNDVRVVRTCPFSRTVRAVPARPCGLSGNLNPVGRSAQALSVRNRPRRPVLCRCHWVESECWRTRRRDSTARSPARCVQRHAIRRRRVRTTTARRSATRSRRRWSIDRCRSANAPRSGSPGLIGDRGILTGEVRRIDFQRRGLTRERAGPGGTAVGRSQHAKRRRRRRTCQALSRPKDARVDAQPTRCWHRWDRHAGAGPTLERGSLTKQRPGLATVDRLEEANTNVSNAGESAGSRRSQRRQRQGCLARRR